MSLLTDIFLYFLKHAERDYRVSCYTQCFSQYPPTSQQINCNSGTN